MKRSQRYSFRPSCVILLAGIFLSSSLTAIASSTTASASSAQTAAPAVESAEQPKSSILERHEEAFEAIKNRKPDRDQAAYAAESADNAVNVYRHSPMVHSIAHLFKLSVEATARIFEAINFLILAIAVLWFLARALPKALRSRSERIQKDLQEARLATEDAARRLQDVEQRLGRLDAEIDSLKSKAEQETLTDEARIHASMEEEKARLIHAAEQEIQSVGANAQRRLKTLAADLIVEYASHHASLDTAADRSIVRSFVSELDSKGRGGEERRN